MSEFDAIMGVVVLLLLVWSPFLIAAWWKDRKVAEHTDERGDHIQDALNSGPDEASVDMLQSISRHLKKTEENNILIMGGRLFALLGMSRNSRLVVDGVEWEYGAPYVTIWIRERLTKYQPLTGYYDTYSLHQRRIDIETLDDLIGEPVINVVEKSDGFVVGGISMYEEESGETVTGEQFTETYKRVWNEAPERKEYDKMFDVQTEREVKITEDDIIEVSEWPPNDS